MKKNIPLKFDWKEKLPSAIYSVLTYGSNLMLVVSSCYVFFAYIGALLFNNDYNQGLMEISLLIAAGTFLHIFVYDEKCKKKLKPDKTKKRK